MAGAPSLRAILDRLVASLDGTGAVFAQLALIGLVAAALVAGGRALLLRRRAHPAGAPAADARPAPATDVGPGAAPPPAPTPRATGRLAGLAFGRRRAPTPAALAAIGVAPVEIARRTGLSRDVVALAAYLSARQG